MKKFLTIIFPLLLGVMLGADTTAQKAEAYISRYGQLAVSEMHRSGVPASITLAQGMLESSYGQSVLAREANNHFGIKCHSDWTGATIHADDDAKGECFRKYGFAADSYRDHSDFLRFKPRYASLFDYERTDYKSWANGLKKAGYATDPKYASKLINIIETYDLGRFDREISSAEEIPESPVALESATRYQGTGRSGTFAFSLSREVLQKNGIPFIYAREGETYRSIADQYDFFLKELLMFNDQKADRALVPGEIVYLRNKAKTAVKGLEKHICSDGETLWGISQKYAVSLKSLMKMNRINDASTYQVREDNTLILRPVKK